MQYAGFALLAVALIALIWGIMQNVKMKKVLAAPFRRTGEIAQNPQVADSEGTISTEGNIATQQPMTAPCSGEACVYYEIEVVQLWDKQVRTENGTKTQSGSDKVFERKMGSLFALDDGSGPVQVDTNKNIDGQLKKAFEEKNSSGFGDIRFGAFTINVGRASSEKRERGTKCIERIIPAQGSLFVMGKLENGVIRHKDGMLGKLLLSTKGRTELVGATKRNMIIGYACGAVALLPGGYFSAFGKPPKDTCAGMKDALVEPCQARMGDAKDVVFSWEVTQPGAFRFASQGTGTDPMMRLWPDITVESATGQPVFRMTAPNGTPISGTAKVDQPGVYRIRVNDTHAGWADTLQGGAGFTINISKN